MLVSYVLRLLPDALAEGQLVGEVEAVRTGERRAVHGTDELMDFCTESSHTVNPSRRIDRKE